MVGGDILQHTNCCIVAQFYSLGLGIIYLDPKPLDRADHWVALAVLLLLFLFLFVAPDSIDFLVSVAISLYVYCNSISSTLLSVLYLHTCRSMHQD